MRELERGLRAKVDRNSAETWNIGRFHHIEQGLAARDFPVQPGQEIVSFTLLLLEEEARLDQIRRMVRERGLLLPDLAETLAFRRAHRAQVYASVSSLCGRRSLRGKGIAHLPKKPGISYAVVSATGVSLYWREVQVPWFERTRLLAVRRR